MKNAYSFMKMFIILVFMLPVFVQAQAIKDSIRKNYTLQDYENFLLKEKRGEIPKMNGPVPSGRTSSDILVNNNVGATSTSSFTQSETTILAWGSNVLIGFNDAGSVTGGANKFTGWSYSSDGGSTFTDGGTLPTNPGGDAGDPVFARDETTGRIYYATLQFVGDGIQLFRSDDNGVSWMAPVQAAPGKSGFQDKQWIAVDNFAGTGQGNVYHVARDFGTGDGIYFFSSTDDGASFGPSGGLQIVSGSSGNVQGAYVTVGPDHSVYVFWWFDDTLLMRKSTDRGANFAAAVTVASGLSGPENNGGLSLSGKRQGLTYYSGFRSNSFPHVAVNPASGHLYAVYNDNPAGDDKANVYMVMSTDGGANWSAPLQINDDVTATDQWQPTITITPDGSKLGIFYFSRQDDVEGNNLITYNGRKGYISGSTVSFAPSVQISDVQSLPEFGRDGVVNSLYMGDYNSAAATNSDYHVVWSDNRDDLPGGFDRKDPNVYYKSIPASLLAGPNIHLNTNSIDFGEVIVNQSATPVQVTITNIGDTDLEITAISAPGFDFSLSAVSLPHTIGSLETLTIDAMFDPLSGGTQTTSFDVTSDAANEAVATVNLEGFGLILPTISTNPTEFIFNVTAGGSDSDQLTISNAGNTMDLNWLIGGSEAPPPPMSMIGNSDGNQDIGTGLATISRNELGYLISQNHYEPIKVSEMREESLYQGLGTQNKIETYQEPSDAPYLVSSNDDDPINPGENRQQTSSGTIVTITHSTDQSIIFGTALACWDGTYTVDNSYWRSFVLSDFGIGNDLNVTEVEIGVETASSGSGTQILTVNLYTTDAPFPGGSLTMIGTATYNIPDQSQTKIVLPVTGTAPAGSELVVEIHSPDESGLGNSFWFGGNSLGETAPTYISASDCSITTPVTLASLGFPDRDFVMNVTGFIETCPWLSFDPFIGTTGPLSSDNITVSVDAAGLTPGTYECQLSISSNDAGNSEVTIPVTLNVDAICDGFSVYFIDSNGDPLAGGLLEYQDGGWHTATEVSDGVFCIDTDRENIKLRMTYAEAQQIETVSTSSDYTFQTTLVTFELRKRTGDLGYNWGEVSYVGFGSPLGQTGEDGLGLLKRELLTRQYTFRMKFRGGVGEITQDIGVDPVVTWKMARMMVQVNKSDGTRGVNGVYVLYKGHSQHVYGTTGDVENGRIRKDLLPGFYKFTLKYYGGEYIEEDFEVVVDTDNELIIGAQEVTVELLTEAAGSPMDGGKVRNQGGTTSTNVFGYTGDSGPGIVTHDLLPLTYDFTMTYDGDSDSKTVDCTAGAWITFNYDEIPKSGKVMDENNFQLAAFPNPFSGNTTIAFTIEKASDIKISVYDRTGRLIDVLYDGIQTEGNHKISWDASEVNKGIYILRLSTGEQVAHRNIVKM